MCSMLVATSILETLEDFLLGKKVFTAYDVTIAARGKTSDNVKHVDVRGIVDNEFITQKMIGYDRELCTLNLGSSPQAQVYFPDTKSANDHPLVDGSSSVSTPVSQPTSQPTSTAPAVDLDDDEYKTTKEGRIQIPRKVLKQVTPNAGSYDVQISGGSLKCVCADARGDVRICLRQFGIDSAKVKLTVDTGANTINLEAI